MTEATLSSQLLGLVAIFIGFFILMLLTAKNEEEAEQKTVIIIEEAEDFREVARRNLKNSDRRFTFLQRLRTCLIVLENASKIMTDWLTTIRKKQERMIF